ncbi:MAG: (2Fe-2S)-binding protein [Bacteroidetes bacterium]|nr:(2Fe-2S)-binding protein [Bacteroidota bacterium]
MALITLDVNGTSRTVDAEDGTPLLWVLRDLLGLTGTKYGCGAGLCGSCTVHLDGEATRSCITPVENAVGKKILTIEGFCEKPDNPLVEAWLDEEVSQCGYCQPGQLMTAAALFSRNPAPSENEINAAMSETLCRCGTQNRIRKAIRRVIEEGGMR